MAIPEDWAPDACMLPTLERPLRVAEFDEFVDLVVPRAAEATGRDLADRESECYSCLTFEFEPAGDDFVMYISVPPSHVDMLDAREARAPRARE
jgi:hypothetical protein